MQDLILVHAYPSRHNGVKHFYFQQAHLGFPILDAYLSVHLDAELKPVKVNNQALSRIGERLPSQVQIQWGIDQILQSPLFQGLVEGEDFQVFHPEPHRYLLVGPEMRWPLQLIWLPFTEYDFRLCWEILQPNHLLGNSYTYLDAQNGALVKEIALGGHFCFDQHLDPKPAVTPSEGPLPLPPPSHPNTYLAFPLGTNHPDQVSQQRFPVNLSTPGSPFGWHDTTGTPGPDHTTLTGNNLVLDAAPGSPFPFPNAPANGGANMEFAFPIPANGNAYPHFDATYTSLFYQLNRMHDVLYAYGFDEVAGNFQEHNYGRGGLGQDGLHTYILPNPPYTSVTGNYSALPDGVNMGLGSTGLTGWNMILGGRRPPVQQLEMEALAPSFIRRSFQLWAGNPGNPFPSTALNLVLAEDASPSNLHGCFPPANATALAGQIALFRDEGCADSLKIAQAESAGALGCVICKEILNGGGNYTQDQFLYNDFDTSVVGIPVAYLPSIECKKLLEFQSLSISVQFHQQNFPFDRSSLLDNSVVMHELMHLVADRLVNGAQNVTCFLSGAATREGWCDWLALWTGLRPSDQGTDPVALGAYSFFRRPGGSSVRGLPYSTNLSVDFRTYQDIIDNTYQGNLWQEGAIWTSTLWDMTWMLIDQYGFDPNLDSGSGGNNIALQLVLDALVVLPCVSDFIDARDAVLTADSLNYGGANGALLWETFSKRGLGWSAGSNLVGFDMPPGLTLDAQEIRLQAKAQEDRVELEWEVLGSLEAESFELQRLNAGGSFERIQQMEGQARHCQDRQVSPGGNYLYRVFIPESGLYSNVVRAEMPFAFSVEVLPNPSQGEFRIVFNLLQEAPLKLRLFTAWGQPIWDRHFTSPPKEIQLGRGVGLSRGVYLLQAMQLGQVQNMQVLVQ